MSEPALATAFAEAQEYARQAKSSNTVRAYRADWRHSHAWCEAQSGSAPRLPPRRPWSPDRAHPHRVSTLTRRMSALSEGTHSRIPMRSPPCLPSAPLIAGIRRTKGTAPCPKKPLLATPHQEKKTVRDGPPSRLVHQDPAVVVAESLCGLNELAVFAACR
jgi:hypothetical protein